LAGSTGEAGAFEPLRDALARVGVKAEQETFQRRVAKTGHTEVTQKDI
jgi:hypothetical protein